MKKIVTLCSTVVDTRSVELLELCLRNDGLNDDYIFKTKNTTGNEFLTRFFILGYEPNFKIAYDALSLHSTDTVGEIPKEWNF